MRQEGEPSVEEILESIKKVIARDNRESAVEQRRQREQAGIQPTVQEQPELETDHILDLGEEAEMIEDEIFDYEENIEPPLVNDAVGSSMRESLAALAMLSEPSARPQIVRSGETSLEGLVRDMLRPMLADWLEHNLPAMVEKMVAAEITRIAGKKS
jgi:cell pole-organizing protein PopZ